MGGKRIKPDAAELATALRTARAILELGYSLDQALAQPLVPVALRDKVREEIERDANIVLLPATTISGKKRKRDWLAKRDRSSWYYWPTLRQYLISRKGWTQSAVRSLEDSSDRVLRQLEDPTKAGFDIRGLVLGYVQSGKTGNFTALAAKAVDCGYRLVIVLSGIDNALRRQTNLRLRRELVGMGPNRTDAVPLPPLGKQWHEFTSDEFDGDFRPGNVNQAALQGTQPVLLVVKKNGAVLRRLLEWLDGASSQIRRELPVLVVDDEADQASIDTRGTGGSADDAEYEPPSVINGLIRQLLAAFERKAYVAYTATPYANILIPHDIEDPRVKNDLYPRDFIVDLPMQPGYFGAEALFGTTDRTTGEAVGGLGVIRHVEETANDDLARATVPSSLQMAIVDFVLAGAARAARGSGKEPVAMLVHTSSQIAEHAWLRAAVDSKYSELRDEWRYQRTGGIRERLQKRWVSEQSATTRRIDAAREVPFSTIEQYLGPFMEAVEVKEVNSATGEVLDYDADPSLKVIAVGGNRLSRGLTIEGLTVSYFVRPSATYDTLMQMGRWFGYRQGYEDLTRIYTTKELAKWFADLAYVETRLREDISVYEDLGFTPAEVGARIWRHPSMQITSPLKQRSAKSTTLRQSYELTLEQTFKFPLSDSSALIDSAERNLKAVRDLVQRQSRTRASNPIWTDVSAVDVLQFLDAYVVDSSGPPLSPQLIKQYIEECVADGELNSWTIAIRGRQKLDLRLGSTNWGGACTNIAQIARTRLTGTDSVGVITGQGDETVDLREDQKRRARARVDEAKAVGKRKGLNAAGREERDPKRGLLLLYPISKASGHESKLAEGRSPLFTAPDSPSARDLVGFAISFPRSNKLRTIEAYLTGTVDWKPVE